MSNDKAAATWHPGEVPDRYRVVSALHELAVIRAYDSARAAGLPVRRVLNNGSPTAALHLDLPDFDACVNIVIDPPVVAP